VLSGSDPTLLLLTTGQGGGTRKNHLLEIKAEEICVGACK